MTKAAELAKMGEVLTNSQIGGRRNIVINGAMQVWQRGTSVSGATSNGFSSADRWQHNASGGTLNLSREAFTLGQTDIPEQFKYYFCLECTTGNNNAGIFTLLEDVTRVQGTHTLSFYAKGTNPNQGSFELELRQYFGTSGSSSVDIKQEFTVTSSWQRFTVTFTPASISGKTVNDANSYFRVYFRQDESDTSTNAWTLDFTGVQLEVGSQATPFEHRSFGEELMLCKRYCNVIAPIDDEAFSFGHVRTSTTCVGTIRLHPVMRNTPTLAFSGVTEFQIQHANTATQTTGMAAGELSTEGVTIQATVGSGLTTGQGAEIRHHTTGATVTIDAEL